MTMIFTGSDVAGVGIVVVAAVGVGVASAAVAAAVGAVVGVVVVLTWGIASRASSSSIKRSTLMVESIAVG
jgi:hypothetical protein